MKTTTTPTTADDARKSILGFFDRDLDLIRRIGTPEQKAEIPKIEQCLAVLLAPTSETFLQCAKDYEAEGKHDLARRAKQKAFELQTSSQTSAPSRYSPEYWDEQRQRAALAGKPWEAYSYKMQVKKALIGERLTKLGFGNTSDSERGDMLADLLEKAHPAQRAALLRKYAKLRHAERVEMAGLPPVIVRGQVVTDWKNC